MGRGKPFFNRISGTYLTLIGLAMVSVFLVACGNGTAQQVSGMPDSANPEVANLRGDIAIDGSSTVFPITEAVSEEFGYLTNGNVRITVGISGTGGGFEKFCNDETQISNGSRPIKQNEVEMCTVSGIEFIELPVAVDGLTVMVNKSNDFVECMTVDELNKIWSSESEGKVTTWSQIRSEWPNEKMDLYAPGVDSGTFDYFTEVVNGQSQASRGDFTASEDDNVLVQGISGSKYSLGYFGYAYYAENADKLKALEIDGGNGCVMPTSEAINNGIYAPLSRPLFIYVRKDSVDTPHLAEFVKYYLGPEGQKLIQEAGYIPFPQKVYDFGTTNFLEGMTGTVFGGDNVQKGPVADVLGGNGVINGSG